MAGVASSTLQKGESCTVSFGVSVSDGFGVPAPVMDVLSSSTKQNKKSNSKKKKNKNNLQNKILPFPHG